MAIKPRTMDYWQLTSQIQKTLAETGGKAPQSPVTTAPITIKTTDVKTGKEAIRVIPAGTPVKEIERQAQERLAALKPSEEERIPTVGIDIPMSQTELNQIAQHNAKATCQADMQKVSIYKVQAWDKDHKWVTLTVQETNKKDAMKKATKAGYKPMFATKQIGIGTKSQKAGEPKVTTLKGNELPEEWLLYTPIEQKEAMGMKKVNGTWIVEVVNLKGDQVLPLKVFKALPEEHQKVALESGWEAMTDRFYLNVKDGATGQNVIVLKESWDALPDEYKTIVETEGFDALQKTIDEAKRSFDNWLGQLKRDYPEIYKTYETEGYEGLNKAIAQLNEQQKSALSTLDKKYKSDDGYNITAALMDKAVTTDQLKLLGFNDSDIKEATEHAGETNEIVAKFDSAVEQKTQRKIWGTKKWTDFRMVPTLHTGIPPTATEKEMENAITEAERDNLIAAIKATDLTKKYNIGGADGAYLGEAWSKMSDADKLKVAAQYASYGGERQIPWPIELAIGMVPVLGTVHFWDKMSPTWKAISIVGDVLCVAAIVHAAAAGARATTAYTAAARLKGAAKGAGRMVIAEIEAPAKIIAHPIETAKGLGRQIRSVAETLAHPKKIPLGSAELSYTTTRLPVKDVGGSAKAMKLRDAAVKAAIQGRRAKARMGNVTLTLSPSELQKVGSAMAVHATPDIRPYLNGAIVKGGTEGSGVFISPNFHSRFALATAFGDIPEEGIRGGLIIRDPKLLKAIAPSGKTYMSTVEMEALLKPGTKLPPPSQILFTRDVAGYKLTLLVIGKPFTNAQIAKLKFLGSLDTVAQIFKPTMKLTGAQRSAMETMDDIIDLTRRRAALARQLDAARAARRAAQIQRLTVQIKDIDRKMPRLIERVNMARAVIRPINVVWVEYAERGILDRWQELNPRKATRTVRGRKLPEIRAGAIIRQATLARRAPSGRPYKPAYVPAYAPGKAPLYVPKAVGEIPPEKLPPYAPEYIPAPTKVTAPSRLPPGREPPKAPAKQPTRLRLRMEPIKGKQRKIREGPALAVWRQGVYWVSIFPPFRTTGKKEDVVYSREKPPWGAVIARGRHSPKVTLRSIGRVPELIEVPMGIVTARIRHGRKLTFSRSNGRRRGRVIQD